MFKIAKPIQEPQQEHINIFQQPQPQQRIRNPSPWNVVGPVDIYNNMNNRTEIIDEKKDKRPKFIIKVDGKFNYKKESVQLTGDRLTNNEIENLVKDAMKREYENEQKRLNLLNRVPQEIRLRLTKQERCLQKLENMQSQRLNDSQIFSQKVGRDRQRSLMEKSADFRGSPLKRGMNDSQEDRRHWYHSLRSNSTSAKPRDDIFHSFATKTTRSFYNDQITNQNSLRVRVEQMNEVIVGQRKLDLEMSQIHPSQSFKLDNDVLKKDFEEVYAKDWDPQMKIMGFDQLYELIQ